MTTGLTVAAIDLGAESGRVTTVRYDGTRLHLDVPHRFTHSPVEIGGLLRWDLPHLWAEIQRGLAMLDAGATPIASVGVDAWGVDYGLLTRDGELVDQPTSYRDPRNIPAMDRALAQVGTSAMYGATGVQIMPINTVFSLVSDVTEHPERLADAASMLMMPDVFHHLLSGSTVTEYTAASTSGLFDMQTGRWATGLLEDLGIPVSLMPEVAAPGTDVGALLGGYSGALRDTRVVLPPAHDTASAVVGAPLDEAGSLFISSGTWSLVGVEIPHPVVNERSRRENLTNEGGYAGTVRLLRNVMGLWILQNCRRQWAREGHDLSYQEIARLAAAEPGQVSLIDPDANDFLPPGDMPQRIRDYCSRAGLPVPQTIGAVARCVIDSLAARYATVLDGITDVTGSRPPAVNIVGGGSSHALLSQLTADATGLPVRCGPVEATALGNAAVQLVAAGELDGLPDIRRVIAASTDIVEYQPRTAITHRTT
jgi:rhamnulokinase